MFRTSIDKLLAVALCLGAYSVSASQSPTNGNTIPLTADSAVFAKLTSTLDLTQCKAGDKIGAQITDDVKVGNQVVIKKGSNLIASITAVEPPKGPQTDTMIGIVVDSVSSKNSASAPVALLIRAIAPPLSEEQASTLSEGRGMPGATTAATVPGRVTSGGGTVGARLTASSLGVAGFPNIHLGSRKDPKTTPMTIISISPGEAKLKKGTQLLLKTPPQ
jgi:hypothetical protein